MGVGKGAERDDEPWPSEDPAEGYGAPTRELLTYDENSDYQRIREMKLEGKTVTQISQDLQLTPQRVKQAITNQIKQEAAELSGDEVTTILQMEMDRIDHVVQSFWWSMKAGDADAAKIILATIKERTNLLKWATPDKPVENGITNNILVVGGTENEFLATLAAARERLESTHSIIDAEEIPGDEPEHL